MWSGGRDWKTTRDRLREQHRDFKGFGGLFTLYGFSQSTTSRCLTSKSGFAQEKTFWAERHSKGFKIIFFFLSHFGLLSKNNHWLAECKTWRNICTQKQLSAGSCSGHQPGVPTLMRFFAYHAEKRKKNVNVCHKMRHTCRLISCHWNDDGCCLFVSRFLSGGDGEQQCW